MENSVIRKAQSICQSNYEQILIHMLMTKFNIDVMLSHKMQFLLKMKKLELNMAAEIQNYL